MVELRCPSCLNPHWEIDCDYREASLLGLQELSYFERTYFCPHCQLTHSGFTVIRKSPPEFLPPTASPLPDAPDEFRQLGCVVTPEFPQAPELKCSSQNVVSHGDDDRPSTPIARFIRKLFGSMHYRKQSRTCREARFVDGVEGEE
jgi:hypothetical protein